MKYILTGIRALLVLFNTALQVTFLSIESLFLGKTMERGFKHRQRWAKNCLWILGIKIDEIKGNTTIEKKSLIISNHRTLLDPIIQTTLMDAYIIAKAEVGDIPIISRGAKMTGIIFVKRENLRSRLAARNKTKELLINKGNVLVYAEGTVGTNRTSDKFKKGTFTIAAEEGVPVIPVAIDYPSKKDFWFGGSMGSQMVRQIGTWRTHVKLHIGDPILDNDPKFLLEKTQKVIDAHLLEMQKGWSQIF